MKDITVVIVNYKMHEMIRACLASLHKDLASSSRPPSTHVVVVDNASQDGVEALMREQYPQYTCIVNARNEGYGSAVNKGIRAATARYYFVLNPDTVFVEPRTLERLLAFMDQHQKIGMIAPKLLNADGSLQYSCNRFPYFAEQLLRRTTLGKYAWVERRIGRLLMKDFDHKKTQPVDWVIGSAMFIRASALERTGLMDERFFMYFEDTDWCRRFWEHHLPVYYVHDIVLIHRHMRGSARVPGLKALFVNRLARVHVVSWIKYMWKWRAQHN